MTGFIARFSLSMALLLAAHVVHAQAPSDGMPKIKLETAPQQVLAGQEFEMIWRVSAKDAQVLQVFLDCADSFGPEKTWKHEGTGTFETRVKHVEETPGPKEYELWAKLQNGQSSRFAGESFRINVAEKGGDKDLAAFLSWMKQVGYSDEVIRIHARDGTKPDVRQQWAKYFNMRKRDLEYRELETMPIVFLDLLANENEATHETLEGQTAKLEEYMTRIYGKTFRIQYVRESVPYATLFGKPVLQGNSKGDTWLKFDSLAQGKYARETAARIIKEHQLPSNAVMIHWAVKTWKHEGKDLKIQDFTGSSPANSGMEFNGYGLGTHAHEWGHGLGLGHMFVDGPGSFASRIWGLDCIMNHTYVGYANPKAGRLLSPLLRYVLEPKGGFLDQKTFANAYSDAMAGTELLKRRLRETQSVTTVASKMTWSTPWSTSAQDSVIRTGLRNRSYEIQQLELHTGIKPGAYSLLASERTGNQMKLIIKQDGQEIASTPFAWQTKVSPTTPHKINIGNYLTLVIGGIGGGKNLSGIGELINERPLVVPEKQ